MVNRIKKVSLQQLIRSSELVIVARPAKPRELKEQIDVTPPGKEPSEEKYPPYFRVRRRYVVEEILYSKSRAESVIPPIFGPVHPDDTPALGEVMEVDAQCFQYELNIHRMWYVDEIRKGALTYVYDAEKPPGKSSGSRLVFLEQRGGKGWNFANDPGEEGIELRAKIEKLLAELHPPPKWPPV